MLKLFFFNQMPFIQDRINWPHYHGDCSYVEFPDGSNMLVDISTKFSGKFLTEKLVQMGVKHIDRFVISHLHQDHTAGFEHLAEHITVGHIYHSGYGMQNNDANLIPLLYAQKLGIPVTTLRSGDHLKIGEVQLDVLFPNPDAPEVTPQTPDQGLYLNLYSLVFRLHWERFSALFTGDIHYESEEQLVNTYGAALESTLLKIPHHGNNTSTGVSLLDAVNPQFAVVMSTGCEWTVQRPFSSRGIPVYGTFCDGDILVETDGQQLAVFCDKGKRELAL